MATFCDTHTHVAESRGNFYIRDHVVAQCVQQLTSVASTLVHASDAVLFLKV